MSSLIATSIQQSKSQSAARTKVAKTREEPKASAKSMAAIAMEKANKSSPKRPAARSSSGSKSSSRKTSSPRKAEPASPSSEEASSSEPETPTEKSPARSPRRSDSENRASGSRSVPQASRTYSNASRVTSETPKQNSVRSPSPSATADAPASRTSASAVRSTVLRLFVGLVFALVVYLVLTFVMPGLRLPQSLKLTAENKESMQLLLGSPNSQTDSEDLRAFRDGLKDSLKDRYSEVAPVHDLWAIYMEMKETNSRLTAVIGMMVGFLVSSVFMR